MVASGAENVHIEHILGKVSSGTWQKLCVLILSGGGDMSFDGQARQEGGDFLFAHLVGMPLALEEDEAANPIDVRSLGAQAVMLHPQMPPDAIE